MTPLQENFAGLGTLILGVGLAAGLLYLMDRTVKRSMGR